MNGDQEERAQATNLALLKRLIGVKSVHYGIDLLTAALLLSGQLQPVGMFVVPEGFMLSLSGPLLGGVTMKTTTSGAKFVMAGLEVITAVFLIARVFGTTGVYVSSHRFSIVVAGLPIGSAPPVAALPGVPEQVLHQYEALLMRHFGLMKRRKRDVGNGMLRRKRKR
ncbi:hypothetical protein [Sulfoacidibacillus thermotolerans]|uniref:Uncharacterized protein n=1 Tax=Sulfoacidibacillus thermotolerans TaxID=1765684 RepID=A0A2U3D6G4_SULT2|nr:hypothetical protein [Sulfoacidibacillus thermotolerans]PWI56872.1 hypothetical protein BM613_11595 [Sulfoacidibacillus thermotolerans]